MRASIIILAVIILIFVVFLFQNFKSVERQETQTITIPTTLPGEEETSGSIDELCSQFEEILGEITCEEAVDISLGGYKEKIIEEDNSLSEGDLDGKIYFMESVNAKRDIWSIGMKLKSPVSLRGMEGINDIKLAVDRNSGELMIIAYMAG